MRKPIINFIYWLCGIRVKPTMTERAFDALHTMDKMVMYIESKCLIDCSDDIPMSIIRRYNIKGPHSVWRALVKLDIQHPSKIYIVRSPDTNVALGCFYNRDKAEKYADGHCLIQELPIQ